MPSCPSCGNGTGDALIGTEDPNVFDGVLYWQCLRCGHAWHTWPTGHHRAAIADAAIADLPGQP